MAKRIKKSNRTASRDESRLLRLESRCRAVEAVMGDVAHLVNISVDELRCACATLSTKISRHEAMHKDAIEAMRQWGEKVEEVKRVVKEIEQMATPEVMREWERKHDELLRRVEQVEMSLSSKEDRVRANTASQILTDVCDRLLRLEWGVPRHPEAAKVLPDSDTQSDARNVTVRWTF